MTTVQRLSRSLLLKVAAASVLLGLLATLANAWLSLRDQTERQQIQVRAVLDAYGPSLANAVWELDDESVQLQLDGLRNFPALRSAEIVGRGVSARYDKRGTDAGAGDEIDGGAATRHALPAPDGSGTVAELTLRLDDEWLARELGATTARFAAAAAFELLLLALLVWAIVVRSVSRPLERLYEHVDRLDVSRLGVPAPRPPGKPNELHALADGITRLQRQLQQQLEAQARQFDEVLRRMADGAGVVDGDGRIVVCNPAWAAMLGAPSPEAALGRRAGDWLAAPAWAEIAARLAAADTLPAEDLALRGETETLPAEASFAIVERAAGGAPARVLLVLRDVRARREAERTLVAAREAAEAATRAKSEFLANMSHEIRTPLNAVLGMTALTLRTELAPRQRDWLEKTRTAAQSLLGIVNAILDFSKIEAGRLELDIAPFDLDAVLDGVVAIVALQARSRGIGFVLDLPAAVPRRLVGDGLRLSQVLVNLGGNAVKFSERGEVEIAVAVVEEEAAEPAGGRVRLRFTVHDDGIGLAPQAIERLFRPFTQVDASMGRRYGGTGLGLAISRQLVRAMGGEVRVSSRPGAGSDFEFDAVFERDTAPTPPRPAPRQGTRLLVVEPGERARRTLCARAAELGCRVTATPTLAEAQPALAGDEIDLVVVDSAQADAPGAPPARPPDARRAVARLVPYGGDDEARPGAELVLVRPVTRASLGALLQRVQGPAGPQQAVAPVEDSPFERVDGLRVLLVEDNPVNQELAVELLRQAGVAVTQADDGEQALQRLGSESFDLVLMDIQMPGIDGLEATRRLRRMPGLERLPVIAMTANALASERAECLAAGMDDHLAKPFEPEELVARLRRWDPRGAAPTPSPLPPAPLPSPSPSPSPIDREAGLHFAADDAALYRRMLALFAESRAGCARTLGAQLDGGDLDAAAALLHGLKSEAAQIGAGTLHDAACELEAAVKARDPAAIALLRTRVDGELRRALGAAAADAAGDHPQTSRLS